MSTSQDPRPRARAAEARRNRETLLEVAARLFSAGTAPVSLEAIAREAGVGIGTLYRHFPTRESLVEALTLEQVRGLRLTAGQLLGSHEPDVALRIWTRSFGTWARTKRGMLDTLSRIIATGAVDEPSLRTELADIVDLFLREGARDGSIRPDVQAGDIAAMLAGVCSTYSDADQQAQLDRLLELVVDSVTSTPASRHVTG